MSSLFHLTAAREESLTCASIETTDVQALYDEFRTDGSPRSPSLRPDKPGERNRPPGVPDPDGNVDRLRQAYA